LTTPPISGKNLLGKSKKINAMRRRRPGFLKWGGGGRAFSEKNGPGSLNSIQERAAVLINCQWGPERREETRFPKERKFYF